MPTYIFFTCICIHLCVICIYPVCHFANDKFNDLRAVIFFAVNYFFYPGQFFNNRFAKHSSTPTFSTAQYDPFSDSNADVVVVTDPPIVCPTAPGAVSYINVCTCIRINLEGGGGRLTCLLVIYLQMFNDTPIYESGP